MNLSNDSLDRGGDRACRRGDAGEAQIKLR